MRNWTQWGKISLLAATGCVLIASTQGCKEINDAAEQCNLTCPKEGIAQGNASISGIAQIDAFFSAVLNFSTAADRVSASIEAQLAKIRTAAGLSANVQPSQFAAEIKAKYRLEGDLKIAYRPPQCAVSAQATLEAAARCDAEVNPGSARVECKGSCEIEASASASCSGDAKVECVGTAPNLECEGTCRGSCELTAAAECTGTCHGTCDGECSVMGADGQCAGRCDGTCEGTCELTAGGQCEGTCKGECTYTPPDGKCEATASVRCKADANASVQCEGRCEGEVEPPSAKAECQASAKAEASVNLECTPPTVDVEYSFAANASAETRAQFEAFLVTFRSSMSVIVADLARGEVIVDAGQELGQTGTAALEASIEKLSADANAKAAIGFGCALDQIKPASDKVLQSTNRLRTNVTAAGALTASLAP